MPIKLLHTADWHLGQTFFEFDRAYEHQSFLNWLLNTLEERKIDVLLISGDVFDVSNPSAASIRLFYDFLRDAGRINKNLQIIAVAGNHDSPSRMEMPRPLLESFNIHMIGNIERNEDGEINFEKIVIPVRDQAGENTSWCIAMPFIRTCDFHPGAYNGTNLAENVSQIYNEAFEYACSKKIPGQSIIAMGHLHALNAQISENDKSERLLMGGQEFVPASIFNDDIAYVALGHIHKAQRVNNAEHIRYSGSPLPMSFSEINYRHQVVYIEIEQEKASVIETIEVPLVVELKKVPSQHKLLDEVVEELKALSTRHENDIPAPYLEVRVMLSGPEPSLRHKIETMIADKNVRLAKIDVKYAQSISHKDELVTIEKFQELQPDKVFQKLYRKKFDNDVPETLLSLFNQVVSEVKASSKN